MPPRPDQVFNEQTKLLANALNTGATSSFTIGVLAPIAAALYTSGGPALSLNIVALAAGGWFFVAVVQHLLARRVLERLRP